MATCLLDDDHKAWRKLCREKNMDKEGVTDAQIADEFLLFLDRLRSDGNTYISDKKLSKLLSQASSSPPNKKTENGTTVHNSAHSHETHSQQNKKTGNGKGKWQKGAGKRFKKRADNQPPLCNSSQQLENKGEPKKEILCNYCSQKHSIFGCNLLKSQVAGGKIDVISNLKAKRVCIQCLLSLDLKDAKTAQHKCRDYFISKAENGTLQKHPLSCSQNCKNGQQILHYSLCKAHPPQKGGATLSQ